MVYCFVISSNVAILKLKGKATIECGKDADLIMVDEGSLEIDMVFAKGKKWWRMGKLLLRAFWKDKNVRIRNGLTK